MSVAGIEWLSEERDTHEVTVQSLSDSVNNLSQRKLMRWRFYIFLMSTTAAFCFMLLTAVTDYGSRRSRTAPLVSAVANETLLAVAPVAKPAGLPLESALAPVMPIAHPRPAKLFIPADADLVLARHDAEVEERANRGKPSHRYRLKWDEDGWYREEVALVTAYCPCSKCCGSHSPGITSIGKNAWTPGLATDPENLAYGTRVLVPGYGLSVIDDTGGAMRRHWRRNGVLHIDVRMTYHHEARQWGKQYLRVKIYDEG